MENRNAEQWNTYQRKYYKQNSHIYKQNVQRRQKRQLHASFKLDEWNKFWLEEVYNLAQLRTSTTHIQWEVDHIIPLQGKLVCGLHVPWNLQVIPMHINRKKSNKDLVEIA